VGGHGAYLCKKSRSDHQGRNESPSIHVSFSLHRIPEVSTNLSFFLIASHGGSRVFDGSRLLSILSLVHGFHLIGRNQHVVFDYAEGGL
jgi:hypothetical protein